jgi:hypothetical protein
MYHPERGANRIHETSRLARPDHGFHLLFIPLSAGAFGWGGAAAGVWCRIRAVVEADRVPERATGDLIGSGFGSSCSATVGGAVESGVRWFAEVSRPLQRLPSPTACNWTPCALTSDGANRARAPVARPRRQPVKQSRSRISAGTASEGAPLHQNGCFARRHTAAGNQVVEQFPVVDANRRIVY